MAKGNETAWKKLKTDISEGNVGRFYLFYGEERYLLNFYKEELIKNLIGDAMPEFNLIELVGKISIDTLVEAVDSYPIMSERKLVIVNDFDVFKADENTKNRFLDIISDLPDYCCLLFIFPADFKPDKRLKLYSSIAKAGEIIDFSRADKNDLISWIKRRFRAQDKTIDAALCEYMIFYCGSLMQGLIAEIDKICAYSKSSEISRGDIDAVATPNIEAVVFDLTDAVVARNYKKALETLDRLVTLGEEPIALLALIGRQMRQIYSACLLKGRRDGISELMNMWGMRSDYPAKIVMNAARGVTPEFARNAVILCEDTDAKLKFGAREEALYEFIARLAAISGGK